MKFANSPYAYEFEGTRDYDDSECAVVRFRLVYPGETTPKEKTVSEVFWVDLNRGGHVVRHERRMQGENVAGLTTVRLRRFEPRPGKFVWLPGSGRVESRLSSSKDRKLIYHTTPIWYETYDLLPPNLRIDQGVKDEAFSVRPRTGDRVSDQIRKAQYEFGQYMIRPKTVTRNPTDTEVKPELDRMLADSKVMAKELKATSPAQEESGWWTRWPWVVASVALVGGGADLPATKGLKRDEHSEPVGFGPVYGGSWSHPGSGRDGRTASGRGASWTHAPGPASRPR